MIEDNQQEPAHILKKVKKAILSLDDELWEAEAVGVFGSLARGKDFSARSDIDIFVIVREKKPGVETDKLWWKRIKRALRELERDVTVLVYTVKGLERISNWYVLRLASEGILVFDKGDIGELFQRITETAREAGMVEERIGDRRVWMLKGIQLGEVVEVQLN